MHVHVHVHVRAHMHVHVHVVQASLEGQAGEWMRRCVVTGRARLEGGGDVARVLEAAMRLRDRPGVRKET